MIRCRAPAEVRFLDCDFGVSGLNKLIDKFNATFTGTLTPAGQALADAGLFSADQLKALGAVVTGYQTDDNGVILRDPATGFPRFQLDWPTFP